MQAKRVLLIILLYTKPVNSDIKNGRPRKGSDLKSFKRSDPP